MLQHRISRHIFLTFLVVMTLAIPVSAQTDTAAINWYSGGDTKLKLAAIPDGISADVLLSGKTSQKTLIVTVAKKDGPTRTNPIPLATDGSFNVRYLLKDGVGTYTITFSGSEQSGSLNYRGLGYVTIAVKKKLPPNLHTFELNSRVIEFVDRVMGTTVGRGECWDLAQQALDQNLADWTRPTTYGLPLNPDTTEIKAGDIIQFRTVKTTEHHSGGVTKWETFGAPDHTAIVYKVLGRKHFTLAHQNIGGKKSVVKSDINLTKVTGGKYWIYRPVALMIPQ
jgi:hypothetical protein